MIQSPASPTLDGLFRRVLSRNPAATALIDPADKVRVTGQPPRRLSFGEADRAVAALAAHFVAMGLPANSVIAVQLPNTVEYVLTLLAAHRAGLVVALLPQLWRQADLTAALNRTGARALVTTRMIDGVDHADLAMNAAVEAFSIRYVGGFGDHLPDGMISLDEVMAEPRVAGPPPAPQDARRAAIISFDVTSGGLRVVPRTHLNLIAAGLAIFLESGLPQGAPVMSAFVPSSFAGIAAGPVTWLLTGGALALHHPFDAEALESQLAAERCAALIAPAALLQRMAASGAMTRLPALAHAVAMWRAPEQVAASEAWSEPRVALTDVYLFGEAGLFGATRGDDGVPLAIKPGPHGAPRRNTTSSIAGETFLTPAGTLALRGTMVAASAYAADGAPPPDHVDTGYAARLDRDGRIHITAPPPGLVGVGGYRFASDDLNEWARRLGNGALLTALPDRLSGHRLAGRATSNARAREALVELGLNPLMTDAFRDRSDAP